MIVISTLDGHDINADEDAIVLMAGPYADDVGPRTYIYGVTQSLAFYNLEV